MGGGPKDREEEGREEGVAVVIGGGGEGELSAMQNSSTPHLVILWFGRRFFAFLR